MNTPLLLVLILDVPERGSSRSRKNIFNRGRPLAGGPPPLWLSAPVQIRMKAVRWLQPEVRCASREGRRVRIRDGVEPAVEKMEQRGTRVQASQRAAELPLPRVPARNGTSL